VPSARSPEDLPWREANRANWDERTPIHARSEFYDLDGFVAGRDSLRPFEPAELGPVEGCSLVHLQCHLGLDTLSWARRGAEVTGVDFSEPALDEARALAARLGVAARFVHGDVYDAPGLLGSRYDVVYTGRGALNWLPDLRRWAEVVAALIAPGGRFYLVEFHPIQWMLADDSLDITYDYFGHRPFVETDATDYADRSVALEHATTYEWAHPLGEVVSALAGVGLRVEHLHEFEEISFERWPFLERLPGPTRAFRLPPGTPALALEYSVLATSPAEGR